MATMKIKKGDMVKVIAGKDKNKGYKDTFSNGKSIDDEIEKMKKNIK